MHLTEVEAKVQAQQIAERRCAVCLHRRYLGSAWGEEVYGCRKGLHWPKYGRCRALELDEGA